MEAKRLTKKENTMITLRNTRIHFQRKVTTINTVKKEKSQDMGQENTLTETMIMTIGMTINTIIGMMITLTTITGMEKRNIIIKMGIIMVIMDMMIINRATVMESHTTMTMGITDMTRTMSMVKFMVKVRDTENMITDMINIKFIKGTDMITMMIKKDSIQNTIMVNMVVVMDMVKD